MILSRHRTIGVKKLTSERSIVCTAFVPKPVAMCTPISAAGSAVVGNLIDEMSTSAYLCVDQLQLQPQRLTPGERILAWPRRATSAPTPHEGSLLILVVEDGMTSHLALTHMQSVYKGLAPDDATSEAATFDANFAAAHR